MNEKFTLHLGDCIEVMRTFPDASMDSICTDPPYELGFMGKTWDASGIANNVAMWTEALRVLKPGGHLLAFSGSRTYHRMVCAIEDAGFEIRDQIMWVYGSGFPKSLDVSKAIDKAAGAERVVTREGQTKAPEDAGKFDSATSTDRERRDAAATDAARQWQGWGTALKPAHEPIVVARKPLDSRCTVAANVLLHGTGAINVDACRVENPDCDPNAVQRQRADSAGMNGIGQSGFAADHVQATYNALGRWPANLIHDGSEEVLAAFPDSNGSGPARKLSRSAKTEESGWGMNSLTSDAASLRNAGTGSAARFFQTCESRYDDDLWQDLNLPSDSAASADASLRQRRRAVFSALAVAAKKALPGELLWDVWLSKEPITAATPKQLRLLETALMQTIRSIDCGYWLAPERARLSLSLNPVQSAVLPTPTATTTITLSHWLSDGSAEPVTFSITPTSLEAGGKDCEPSWAAGGARFKYCAKASKADRCEGNTHPTVKPTDLMRYLCRLVTPPGGVVLDPFMGSGSTGRAAVLEGFEFVGIDMTPEYVDIARSRIGASGLVNPQGELL